MPLPEAGGRPSEGFDTTPMNQTQTFYSEKFGFELRQRKMEVREIEGGGLMIMMKGMDLRHQWSDEYCWRRVRRPCLRTQDSISYLYPLMMKNTCHLRGRT